MCASNKLLAYSLSLLMLLQPLLLRAQTSEDMRSISLEAYEYGRELVDGTSMPTIDESGTISLPATGDTAAGDRSLSIDDLSPSSGSHYTVDELREVSNDNTGMLEMGSHVRTQLSDDAHSDNPSSAGAAYQLMSDQSRRLVPDMSNDPSLLLTREILTDIAVNEEFADCEAQTQFIPGTTVTHLPDLKHCNRVVDRSGSCTVYHDYTAEVIHHHDGPYNMLPLDEDSFHVWIGNLDEDNRWRSPVCTIFEAETQIAVVRPEAITAVILERVQWDDRVQLWVGKTGEEQLVFTGPGAFPAAYAGEIYPHGLLPPETPGPCELNTSWSRSPNLDITEAFLAGVEAGDIVSLFSRVSVFDGGELFARLRIDYDPAIAIEDGLWSPPDCINAANAYYDGFASGSISCTLMPTETAEGSGCTAINGITVCDSDLAPSPFAEINPLCERVEVTTEYDFYKGDYTYINENGTEITITGGDGDLDSCRDYEEDTTCAFVSQTCVEGAEANGNCYVYEETWDCG
ncbi:MAG: hypothetical protein KTR20_06070, partial [Cellvibrionaceae bacterium]|nr:hypothetical protein [Cellvibrionaceae bacterium]